MSVPDFSPISPVPDFPFREYPEAFFASFVWGVQESGDLAGTDPWQAIPGATVQDLGGGLYVIDVGPLFSGFARHFFRLTMSLP